MGKGVSKMRLKDFIGCFIFCACLVLPCFAVNAAGVTNYSSFISADYWVKNKEQFIKNCSLQSVEKDSFSKS